MVIVIDLEEEEAKKNDSAANNAKSSKSSPNNASKQTASDTSTSKSEQSAKTEDMNPPPKTVGQEAAAAAKPVKIQNSKSINPGNTTSGQENPSVVATESKKVVPPTPEKHTTSANAEPAKATPAKAASKSKASEAADKRTMPATAVESKSSTSKTREKLPTPVKAASKSHASEAAESRATPAKPAPSKSSASQGHDKLTTPTKTLPKSPAAEGAQKHPTAKTAPSKSSMLRGADNLTIAASMSSASKSADKLTSPAKPAPSKSSASQGADKLTSPAKPASSKSSASRGAEKSTSEGAVKLGKSKRQKEKHLPPSIDAKPKETKSSTNSNSESKKPDKTESCAPASEDKESQPDKGRDKTLAKEDGINGSSVKEENKLGSASAEQTTDEQTSAEQTGEQPVTPSPSAEAKTETIAAKQDTNAIGQDTKARPTNSVSAAELKAYKQEDKTGYSTFSSLFKVPTVNSWTRTVRDRLKQKGHDVSILDQFGKCSTDEERFSLLYNMPAIHDVLQVTECYQGKNESYSKDLRMQGNIAFQKKDYDKALELYSQSIIKAPCDGCPELALTLANRSAVFYHMQKYVLALQDIKLAFRHGYPDHLHYKLYERRGKASYCLRLKEDANCAFQDAINVLDRSQLAQHKMAALKSDLMKQLQKCVKLVPGVNVKTARDFNHNHTAVPEIAESRSAHVPCMMKSLVVKSNPQRGRGLYATRNIEVGEVLVVEKPYASVTLTDFNLSHCHHCCNRVHHPIPCRQCSGVVFCSEECLDAAWTAYHYAECKYHDLIQRSQVGLGHLALRMVLKAGHKYLREFRKTEGCKPSDPVFLGCNANGIYDSDNYLAVYNLVGHTEQRSRADLFKRTLTAVFLLKCMENSSYFDLVDGDEEFDIDEEKVSIGGNILRHIQMLPCNAHEVSEFTLKTYQAEMSENVEVGSAIYSTLSLINHSCDPSVVRHSYADECVVRAIRNIDAGEEILDNYGVLYPVMSKAMRQEKLSFQYHFDCSCNACSRNWPMYDKIRKEQPTLRCKKCRTGRVGIPGDNRTTRAICNDCRDVMDITPDLLHLSRSEEFFQGSLQKVFKGEDLDTCLPLLEAHLRLIDRLLFPPWRDYNDCQEAIKQCYAIKGNCRVLAEPDADDEELMETEDRRR